MTNKIYNVLFLCTGNSARSVISEALLNRLGEGQFRAFSAGSHPKDDIHPSTVKFLNLNGYSADDYRSKSWNEFAEESAPNFDVVITVCDNAASEVCPIWSSSPIVVHWSIPDPVAVEFPPSAVDRVFQQTYSTIEGCIKSLIQIMNEDLTPETLPQRLNQIGSSQTLDRLNIHTCLVGV